MDKADSSSRARIQREHVRWFQAGSPATEELKNKGCEPREAGLAGEVGCLPQKGK